MNRPETTGDAAPPHLAGGRPADPGQLILERRRRLVAPWLSGGGHLVDYGCGNGAQTLLLERYFDRVTGLDVEPAFLAEFERAAIALDLKDKVDCALIGGKPPLAAGSADVVTSFTVLEHVPDEVEALQRMRTLLRPGGRLLLSVPNRWWIFETHGADLPLLPWNRVPLVSWWPRFLHDRYARARIYTVGDIVRLVTTAGFGVEDVFRMTAPMDMIAWKPLRDLVRGTVFRSDRAFIPFLATEIIVAATR